MKKIILMLLALITFMTGMAQDERKANKKEARRQRISAITKQEEEGVIKYKRHTVFGAKLTTDGYGGFIEVGRAQSIKRGLLFQLEISERKHQKEEKQQLGFTRNVTFIYSKVNFFYPVKLGVQQQFILGNKGNKNGVSVTGNIGGGFIAGLLRPYMVDLDDSLRKGYVSYYDEPENFLNTTDYLRSPSFGTGWNRLKVTPGAYIKPALRFDYGKYNEMVNALEVGVTAEFFSKPITQMVFEDPRRFFFSGFVTVIFGRRK